MFFLNVRHSRRGSLFCPYCRTAGGSGTEELADFALIYPTLHSFKGRRRQHFAVTVMALLADDTLRFHLFDNTRGTVIADAELTLNPGNRRFALLGHKVDCLIEQRIQLFPAVEAATAAFAFAVGGNAIHILRATAGFPV